jgi:hypothetical protein
LATTTAPLTDKVVVLGIDMDCWIVLVNVRELIVKDWSTVLVMPLGEAPALVNTTAFPLGDPFGPQLALFDQFRFTPPGVQVKVAAPADCVKTDTTEIIPTTTIASDRHRDPKNTQESPRNIAFPPPKKLDQRNENQGRAK